MNTPKSVIEKTVIVIDGDEYITHITDWTESISQAIGDEVLINTPGEIQDWVEMNG